MVVNISIILSVNTNEGLSNQMLGQSRILSRGLAAWIEEEVRRACELSKRYCRVR